MPSLDGIRAASIALVFVAHAGWGQVVPGGLGVTIFFFLSGFLITSLFRIEQGRAGSISIKNFYLRRVFRILPPFYVSLATATALVAAGALPGQVNFTAIALLAAHIGNYAQIFWTDAPIPAGTGVYWSLAVEEHYYLVFPFVASSLLNGPRRRTMLVLLAAVALVLGWRTLLYQQGAPPIRTNYGTDTRVDSILWGVLLALGCHPTLDPQFAAKLARWRSLSLTGSLGLLVFSLTYRSAFFRETARYTLQGAALLPIFYFAVREPDWWPFAWLNRPLVRYVGVISYTFYLVHHFIIYAVEHVWPAGPLIVRAVVALVLSVAAAAASQSWVEKPLAAFRSRYA